jgi:hypothetical protein
MTTMERMIESVIYLYQLQISGQTLIRQTLLFQMQNIITDLQKLSQQQDIIDLFVYQQLNLLHQMVMLETFGFNIHYKEV